MQNMTNPTEGPPIPAPLYNNQQGIQNDIQQWAQVSNQDHIPFNKLGGENAEQAMLQRSRGWLDLSKPAQGSQKLVLTKLSMMLQNDEPLPRISPVDWYAAFSEMMPETDELLRINLGEVASAGLDSCFAVKTSLIILIQSILPKDKDNE